MTKSIAVNIECNTMTFDPSGDLEPKQARRQARTGLLSINECMYMKFRLGKPEASLTAKRGKDPRLFTMTKRIS